MIIRQRSTNACLWDGEAISTRAAVEKAVASGAVLRGAVLTDADLRDDKIKAHIASAMRSDGYEFRAFLLADDTLKIHAGCRWFTPDEARSHWTATRSGTQLGDESLALVAHLEAMAAIVRRYAAA